MHEKLVYFDQRDRPAKVESGTLVLEAARQIGIDIQQPCGGQGRCGRCIVHVEEGRVRRRSSLRISPADQEKGYALACQSVIEENARISIPEQESIERRLVTTIKAREVALPAGYLPAQSQSLKRVTLKLSPPSLDDQTDDWSRLQQALRSQADIQLEDIPLALLKKLGGVVREGDWQVSAVIEIPSPDQPQANRLVDVLPGQIPEDQPLWGLAVDIGTTTVSVWLVDLASGRVKAQTAEYNGQIKRGEDVISRIIYASKNDNHLEMQTLVVDTINQLTATACKRINADPSQIYKAVVAGNSTMIHMLLGLPAESIRLSPFITTANFPPVVAAGELGLNLNTLARVDCLPGVASYVGADITAGVLSSGMEHTSKTTLFMDIGTNGEIVFGSKEWLVTCACSAGPAFEGAGVLHGMRATAGAIEEVWVHTNTLEPTLRVIGNKKPRGLCGSGLISLMAEMFVTGLVDKSGNINLDANTPRVRQRENKREYVLVWADDSGIDQDIVITEVDIDNLMRAKAAVYAGFTVMAERVGLSMGDIEQVMIGGAFGQYINTEKAIQIGLLPDMPWDSFHFLGNTAVQGAYLALIDRQARQRVNQNAAKMTYIELSADNSFFEAFTSALFLPHTDMSLFPSIAAKNPSAVQV